MKKVLGYLGEEWSKCMLIGVPFYLTIKAVKFVLTNE